MTAALLVAAPFATPVRAGDEPFTGASNYGLTGIFEIPTARVLPENRYRFGITAADPYNHYWGTIGLFDRIEVNGRITEIRGVPGFTDIGSRYGDLKDRSFDFKLQIVKESKYLPALAFVVTDPHGTRLYSSQSIVASKQVYPFDLTIGMGNGRFGKEPLTKHGEGFRIEMLSHPKSWWRSAQPFGGIQFEVTNWLMLAAEYSPIHYERQIRDPAQPRHFTKPVPSNINFGLRLKPFRNGEIDIAWQRGEQLTIGGTLQFDIGRPILPIHDPPYREPERLRQSPLHDRITEALLSIGFSDVGVEGDDFFLRIDVENNRYFFTPDAVKALLDAVAPIVPPKYEYLRIRFKENGIPVSEFVTTVAALEELREKRITRERFFDISSFRTEFIGNPIPQTQGRRWYRLEAMPTLNMYLNDRMRFFSYRFGAAANLDLFPWQGGSIVMGVEAYPVNNINSTAEPLSIPVRSDIGLYKKENLVIPARLMLEQIVKTDLPVYARAAAGYLEVEYAGLDAEIAAPLFSGRIIANAGGSLVRKRSPSNSFEFSGNQWYKTAFIGGRLHIPEADLWIDIKGGRFLAGDWGARFSLSKFIRGVTVTAWYSVTDTSSFTDQYNRGYHDKGISVTIPIRLFLGRDSRTAYRFSVSPWTRDTGQDIEHYRTLPDYIGRNTDILLDKDTRDLYKK